MRTLDEDQALKHINDLITRVTHIDEVMRIWLKYLLQARKEPTKHVAALRKALYHIDLTQLKEEGEYLARMKSHIQRFLIDN